MSIKRTDSGNNDFQKLVAQPDSYLAQVNGDKDVFHTQLNLIEGSL